MPDDETEDEFVRTPMSRLIGVTVEQIMDWPNNHVAFLNARGKIIFTVSRDDLFDEAGNRFEDDI